MTTMQQEQASTMRSGAGTEGSAYATGHHEAGRKLVVPLVIIVVALAIGGYAAYEIFVNDKKPGEIVSFLHSKGQEIIALFWNTGGSPPPAGGQEVVAAPPLPPVPAPAPAPAVVAAPAPAALLPEADAPAVTDFPPAGDADLDIKELPVLLSGRTENPYLELPNRLPDGKVKFARAWSLQEEEVWRSGIAHQFAWQQYKTVQDVITMRLAGSDAILWEALNNPRLWTRMRALAGLIRFGLNVDSDMVLRALGEARPSLVANYFKRFMIKSTPSQRFAMRYALRTVAARARLHIVKALVVGGDETSNLYLAAATLDPDSRVSEWAKATLERKYLPANEIENYRH